MSCYSESEVLRVQGHLKKQSYVGPILSPQQLNRVTLAACAAEITRSAPSVAVAGMFGPASPNEFTFEEGHKITHVTGPVDGIYTAFGVHRDRTERSIKFRIEFNNRVVISQDIIKSRWDADFAAAMLLCKEKDRFLRIFGLVQSAPSASVTGAVVPPIAGPKN